MSQMQVTVNLNAPQARWTGFTLGEIEDAWAVAGREIARFAIDHLNRPEWTRPYGGIS
jgi:hypothetical protein